MTISGRVLGVLKYWLTRHYEDFSGDPQLISYLKNFIETHMKPTMKVPANQLLKTLEKKVNAPFSIFSYILQRLLKRKKW